MAQVQWRHRPSKRWGTFNLDFSGLTIEQITVNDLTGKFRRDDRELIISPSQPIRESELFSVTVAYHGTPVASQLNGSFIPAGWYHNSKNEIYVFSETSGAAHWYPVNDHPLDKAAYSLTITVPKPYVAATNGLLQQTVDNGESTTYVWESAEPIASYLVTLNIAEYVIESERGPEDVIIRNFYPPDFPEFSKEGFNQPRK